nr:N-acetylmuramoyl-L-alanine amidase [uncultured Bacillus sp.]
MELKTKHIMIWTISVLFLFLWVVPTAYAEEKNPLVKVETDGLNVRSGPSLQHELITTLNKGSLYPVIQKDKDWIEIDLGDGDKGWVADYLVTIQKETTDLPHHTVKQETAHTGTITADAVNIRTDPALTADIIGKLNTGADVEVLSTSDSWIKIQVADRTGWVSTKYVEVDVNGESAANETSSEKLTDTSVIILHNGTNIRKAPNTQALIIERANKGDRYEAVQLTDEWYEIKLSEGDTAYVAAWIVSVSEKDSENKKEKNNLNSKTPLKNKTIVIDPGHGGEDGGTIGGNGLLEKRLTLKTAKYLSEKLQSAGANVILTRNSDIFIPLTSRVQTADYRNADAFISLHFDHSKDRSARGLTTYFYHPWQRGLAVEIHSAVAEQTRQNSRGVQFGDYYVIRENNQKAVLIELGYLSNPTEELLVGTDQFQELAATGIYEGLGRYFNDE